MELVRNIASGKYFILLEDDPGGIHFLLITPEGKVRQVERRLFSLSDIVDRKPSLCRCNLTEQQLKKYEDYFDN